MSEINEQITSPLKAIRAKCMDCTCGQLGEIKDCIITVCPLHPFRFGKNPFRKHELTPEQRKAAAERLQKARGINFDHGTEN